MLDTEINTYLYEKFRDVHQLQFKFKFESVFRAWRFLVVACCSNGTLPSAPNHQNTLICSHLDFLLYCLANYGTNSQSASEIVTLCHCSTNLSKLTCIRCNLLYFQFHWFCSLQRFDLDVKALYKYLVGCICMTRFVPLTRLGFNTVKENWNNFITRLDSFHYNDSLDLIKWNLT